MLKSLRILAAVAVLGAEHHCHRYGEGPDAAHLDGCSEGDGAQACSRQDHLQRI